MTCGAVPTASTVHTATASGCRDLSHLQRNKLGPREGEHPLLLLKRNSDGQGPQCLALREASHVLKVH